MALPTTPQNFWVQSGNQQIYLSWDILTTSPTLQNYIVQRSSDGVTYSTLASPLVNEYLDTSAVLGTQYYYKVAGVNADGTGIYTTAQIAVAVPTAEMTLGQLRLAAQQRADLVNSQFITLPEWNSYVNQSLFELYDLLITLYQDYNVTNVGFTTTGGSTSQYALPDGTNYSGAPAFYKLLGVDLGLNSMNNAFVTMKKFNFIDRNKYLYPTPGSTIYGVFNAQYRVVGSNLMLIPTPAAGQPVKLWYIPRLPQLLKDTDTTTIGISGWLEYVIIRAAILALTKEESDSSTLQAALMDLRQRIEGAAANRDAGQPDTVSDTRTNGYWGYSTGGWGYGPGGGF